MNDDDPAPCRCCDRCRGGVMCETATGTEHGCTHGMPPAPLLTPSLAAVDAALVAGLEERVYRTMRRLWKL